MLFRGGGETRALASRCFITVQCSRNKAIPVLLGSKAFNGMSILALDDRWTPDEKLFGYCGERASSWAVPSLCISIKPH